MIKNDWKIFQLKQNGNDMQINYNKYEQSTNSYTNIISGVISKLQMYKSIVFD